MNNRLYGPTGRHPLRKLLAAVVGIAVLVLALMFSVVVIAVLLIAGLMAWAWLRWKTRGMRRQMREFRAQAEVMEGVPFEGGEGKGVIIEGEAVRVSEK